MRELGLVILVCGFLIFALIVLAYIENAYGYMAFWVALSVFFMFIGTVLIFIYRDKD